MKEFEKYWEIIKGKNDFSPEKHYAGEAWEAALEWALDMKKEDVYAGDVYNKAYHIPDWGVDLIENELDGEEEYTHDRLGGEE